MAEQSPDAMLAMYQAFMNGYVKRINEASFNATIGGVRIGSARYTRLAQINLKTRIITFSRFAVANVPERGRRYLVLHELAHVLEASHNKRFWNLVGAFEPEYKAIGRDLDKAFKKNVRSEHSKGFTTSGLVLPTSQRNHFHSHQEVEQRILDQSAPSYDASDSDDMQELELNWLQEEFFQDEDDDEGTISGGFELEMAIDHDYLFSPSTGADHS